MKYFTIPELTRSATASKKGIDNTPSTEVKTHLIELIENLLDPLRYQWGEYCKRKGLGSGAIIVSSGYRCPALNRAVGGVASSAHLGGWAADTVPGNGRMTDYKRWILNEFIPNNPQIKFDQIILEKSRTSQWVHIAIRDLRGRQRQKAFSLNV